MKAISSVIATILMLMIVVALAGSAYFFLSGLFMEKTAQIFIIVDSYNDTVTIMNDGQAAIHSMTGAVEDADVPVLVLTDIGRLVGYWKFDEGSGNTATDSSGNGNDGTIYYHEQLRVDYLGGNDATQPIYGANSRTSQSMTFLKGGTISSANNLVLKIYKVGTPTGTATIRFSTSRTSGGVTTTFLAESLPTAASDISYTLPDTAIVSGTTYYLTVQFSGGDASNYVGWRYSTTNRDWAGGTSGKAWFGDTGQDDYDMSMMLTASTVGWIGGRYGTAIEFDGHNTYVQPPAATYNALTGNKTIVAWLYPHTSRNMGVFQTHDSSWGTTGYDFVMTSSRYIRFRIANGTHAEYKSSSGTLTLNAWNHVAAAYDADNDQVSFYINSQPSGTSSYTTILDHVGGTMARIGNEDGFSGEMVVDGILDEVRIYNEVLAGEEVRNLYSGLVAPGQVATVKFMTELAKGTHTIRLCTPSMCAKGYLTII